MDLREIHSQRFALAYGELLIRASELCAELGNSRIAGVFTDIFAE